MDMHKEGFLDKNHAGKTFTATAHVHRWFVSNGFQVVYYSDKGKARLMKAVRKSRSALLDALEEAPILSYSFADDGKPSVRVYVTLKGVGALPREDILADFERQALDLRVRGYEGRTMRLYAPELWAPIDPAKCKVKVKPDSVYPDWVVTLHMPRAGLDQLATAYAADPASLSESDTKRMIKQWNRRRIREENDAKKKK